MITFYNITKPNYYRSCCMITENQWEFVVTPRDCLRIAKWINNFCTYNTVDIDRCVNWISHRSLIWLINFGNYFGTKKSLRFPDDTQWAYCKLLFQQKLFPSDELYANISNAKMMCRAVAFLWNSNIHWGDSRCVCVKYPTEHDLQYDNITAQPHDSRSK